MRCDTEEYYFFTVDSTLDEKICRVTLFMKIKEGRFENKTDEKIYFQTYYSVSNLLMMRMIENTKEYAVTVYSLLSAYIVKNKLKVCTPFINVFIMSSGHQYRDVYIGIVPNEKYDYTHGIDGARSNSEAVKKFIKEVERVKSEGE